MKNMKKHTHLLSASILALVSALGIFSGAIASAQSFPNLVKNPSFEASSLIAGQPDFWTAGSWGTNNAVFSYPVSGANGSGVAAKVEITQYTDGDAKWFFSDVPVSAGKDYQFSDSYMASVPTFVTLRYSMTDGSFLYLTVANPQASASWTTFSQNFTAPAGAVSLSVFHLLQSSGALTVDNFDVHEVPVTVPVAEQFPTGMVTFSFDDGWITQYLNAFSIMKNAGIRGTFYMISQETLAAKGEFDGVTDVYMTKAQMLEMQSAGNEIGSHTQHHPWLSQITPTEMRTEIAASRTDLLSMGVTNVSSFAYPYGDYNTAIEQAVKQAGYAGARTIVPGFSVKSTDKYALVVREINDTITLDQVKYWIDTAEASHTWLILLFHHIQTGQGENGSNPDTFRQIAEYVKAKNLKTITVREGLEMMYGGALPPAPVSLIPAPTANKAAGTYSGSVSVTLSSQKGTTIRYTTNGTAPTCSSGTLYLLRLPITIRNTTRLQAIACKGKEASSVYDATYVVTKSTKGGILSGLFGF